MEKQRMKLMLVLIIGYAALCFNQALGQRSTFTSRPNRTLRTRPTVTGRPGTTTESSGGAIPGDCSTQTGFCSSSIGKRGRGRVISAEDEEAMITHFSAEYNASREMYSSSGGRPDGKPNQRSKRQIYNRYDCTPRCYYSYPYALWSNRYWWSVVYYPGQWYQYYNYCWCSYRTCHLRNIRGWFIAYGRCIPEYRWSRFLVYRRWYFFGGWRYYFGWRWFRILSGCCCKPY